MTRGGAWTPARRAEAAERSRRAWRERHPEKAAIRDGLLATVQIERCRCGATEVTLFVTDYEASSYVWRCRACAEEAQRTWLTPEPVAPQPVTTEPEPPAHEPDPEDVTAWAPAADRVGGSVPPDDRPIEDRPAASKDQNQVQAFQGVGDAITDEEAQRWLP